MKDALRVGFYKQTPLDDAIFYPGARTAYDGEFYTLTEIETRHETRLSPPAFNFTLTLEPEAEIPAWADVHKPEAVDLNRFILGDALQPDKQERNSDLSDTYGLACKDCKEYIWTAQAPFGGGNVHFYSGDEKIAHLGEFLFSHKGHPLTFDRTERLENEDCKEVYADDEDDR